MIDGQLGRRNLSSIQRVAVTEKYRPYYEEKAKENISLNGGDKKSELANLPKAVKQKIDTRKELSKLAGVGERTYGKATAILDSDNKEVKQKVMSGEKSIDAGYNEIKPKKEEPKKIVETPVCKVESTIKKCLKCKQEKPLSELSIYLFYKIFHKYHN